MTAIAAIPTTAMRGTDSAALASSWTAALATALGSYTAARAGYLDNLSGGAVTAVGPTKAEMDTAHALLATPAQVATELGTYDAPTRMEATSDMNTLIAMIAAFGG